MDANVVGLVLNMIGAIVLLISFRSQNLVITKVTKYLFADSSPEQAASKPSDRAQLEREVKLGARLNYIGLILFVIGFGLQIICLQFNCFQ